jgi:PhzF family phenazine biosynthesis protein
MQRKLKIVDVFSTRPLLGNPVAVVLDAEGLDTAAMEAIARWTNLSETTFVLPPTVANADYRLRIFAPKGGELPFAGHPTLGSAHALLEAGRVHVRDGRLVQESGVGLVHLTVEEEVASRRLAFDLPDAVVTPLTRDDVAELEAALGAPVKPGIVPAAVDCGPVWIVTPLSDADALLAVQPDLVRVARLAERLGAVGISIFGDHAAGEAAIEVRCFAPSIGIEEDPVCGSGNGQIGLFRHLNGMIAAGGGSYVAAQGCRVGRDGKVSVTVAAEGKVRVGGACVTTVDGTVDC